MSPRTGKNLLSLKKDRICVCHDIERGLGHVDTDPGFAESGNKTSADSLERMPAIEAEMNVKATHNVLGCLLSDVREKIAKADTASPFTPAIIILKWSNWPDAERWTTGSRGTVRRSRD